MGILSCAMLEAFSFSGCGHLLLGAGLGLFDYMADLCNFDDSPWGRAKTALATFLPPTLCGLIWPQGFLYAIGWAGLAATIWSVFDSALMLRASRKKFRAATYRAPWGRALVPLLLAYGCLTAVCHILYMLDMLRNIASGYGLPLRGRTAGRFLEHFDQEQYFPIFSLLRKFVTHDPEPVPGQNATPSRRASELPALRRHGLRTDANDTPRAGMHPGHETFQSGQRCMRLRHACLVAAGRKPKLNMAARSMGRGLSVRKKAARSAAMRSCPCGKKRDAAFKSFPGLKPRAWPQGLFS